jgi:hypothetical protein
MFIASLPVSPFDNFESFAPSLQLMKRLIGTAKWSTAREAMDIVVAQGESITRRVKGRDSVVGNIVRRLVSKRMYDVERAHYSSHEQA